MRGDILIWLSSGSPIDRLVAWWTKGPGVHASVDCGDGTHIEAVAPRIRRVPIPDASSRLVRIPFAAVTPRERIEVGIDSLMRRVGRDSYGYLDATLNQVLRRLHCPYFIGSRSSEDCSDLAASFILETTLDQPLWERLSALPAPEITPNDILRCFGVLDASGRLPSPLPAEFHP